MDELISIHAPRTGSDGRASKGARFSLQNFNPRSPHGERPGRMPESTPARDFNPRSPHGERPASMRYTGIRGRISIHAPRTGSDCPALRDNRVVSDFNPRSPHGERPRGTFTSDFFIKFQSTLPARGATKHANEQSRRKEDISIHAPRTGSDGYVRHASGAAAISIHAPRTGSDGYVRHASGAAAISIHAPRTGSDGIRMRRKRRKRYFNPRSPHGERLYGVDCQNVVLDISIHAPRTGSDVLIRFDADGREIISIHAPRTGSDGDLIFAIKFYKHFNPRSPHGERPPINTPKLKTAFISIHAPRTGSDLTSLSGIF